MMGNDIDIVDCVVVGVVGMVAESVIAWVPCPYLLRLAVHVRTFQVQMTIIIQMC
jgi:hypothetical protein